MTRIEVKRWNGQFDRPSVLTTIRRKIQGAQVSGTVLIDLESAVMTQQQVAEITRGWLDYKVKCCGSVASLPHPLSRVFQLIKYITSVKAEGSK